LSDKAPTTIADRLRFAYGGAAPAEIVRFFERKSEFTPFDGYVAQGGPLVIARRIVQESRDAHTRLRDAERSLDELDAQLAFARRDYAATCEALDAPPPLTATPREVGLVAVDKAGYERLIPEIEKARAVARAQVEQIKAHADNWRTLADAALVIAGQTRPSETLASKIGAPDVRF
jgi:hypothetical protein